MRGMKIYHNNLTSMDYAFNHQKKEVLAIVFFKFPCYGIGGRNIWDYILRQKGADQRTVPALAQQLHSLFVHEINGEKHNHYRSFSTYNLMNISKNRINSWKVGIVTVPLEI